MKPLAYEGSEPYIFISYAHRDSERVFEVLQELQDRGYRFWYDDGIAPGSEWPEDIARHLDAAAMVMAFVTLNSMKSQNCRREINFSLSREKPFLSVLLEETEMPLGMQMQLSAQQSILRYNYDSWGGFINKILACPDIEPCQMPREPDVESEPAPVPAAQPVAETAHAVTVADRPAPAQVVQPTYPEPEEEYHTVEVVPAADSQEQPKRKLPKLGKGTEAKDEKAAKKLSGQAETAGAKKPPVKLIALVAAAIALVLVGVFAIRGVTGSFKTSWDQKLDKGSSSISLSDKTLTQGDLDGIASMKNLTALNLTGCDLSACDFSAITFASPELGSVSLSACTGISDFSFLKDLQLKKLQVAGQESFDDAILAALKTDALTTLDVSGTAVTDLAPLKGAPLTDLAIADTQVSDLTPLADSPDLMRIDGSGSGVISLDPLAELANLRNIAFDGCRLADALPSFSSLKLEKLSLADAGVRNLKGLTDCTVLKELDLSGNESMADIDWLDAQNYATLTKLNLARTSISADKLSWIPECTGLTELTLDGIELKDLTICSGLEGLEYLSAINCQIEDIATLSDCPNLKTILLGANQITDVSSLSSLTLASRVTLDLTGNKLESVSALPAGKYRAILLYGNASDDVASTLGEVEAYEVVTPYFEGIEKTSLADFSHFTRAYVVGCPDNMVLKLEEAFGSNLQLVSEDELWDIYTNDSFDYPLGRDLGYTASALTDNGSGGTGLLMSISDANVDMEPISFDLGN